MYSKIILPFILVFVSHSAFSQLSPRVTFATYIGGSGDEEYATNIQLSENDDVFLCLWANDGCVTTPGVHQQSYGGGGNDVLVQKRDKNGKVIWSTYYGGSGYDGPGTLKLLKSEKIALVGQTTSRSGITKNGHQQTYRGGEYDGFLAVFNADGTLDWATYIGGSGDDDVYGVAEDSEGNIYVCGYTNTTTGLSTSDAFQISNKGGYDGFLSKYASTGNLIWSTYVGGTGSDWLTAIQIDSKDNIWVGGMSYATSGLATFSAFSTVNAGNGDGLLMSFDKDGKRLYGTYYGGSGRDEIYVIYIDQEDNIWFGGPTASKSGIATINALILQHRNREDVFLAKFNKDIKRVWATYLGGSEWDTFFGMDTDKDGNAILSLMTRSNDFNPIKHAMQSEYGGGLWDAVCIKLDPNGKLIWSTYIGGDGNDRGVDVKVNSEGDFVYFMSVGSKNMHTDDADDTTLDGESDALLVILKEVDISKTTESTREILTLNIMPNPVLDRLTIDKLDIDRYRIEIFDNLGKAMCDYTQEANSIDVRTLTPGVYHIRLTDKTTGNVAQNSFIKI